MKEVQGEMECHSLKNIYFQKNGKKIFFFFLFEKKINFLLFHLIPEPS